MFIAALTISCLIVVLLAVELALRAAGYVGVDYYHMVRLPCKEVGHRERPNATFLHMTTAGYITGTTDPEGYRPLVTSRHDAGVPLVICVGDSITFCAQSRDERTWPEVAAQECGRLGMPCKMLNRAVTGYNGLQALATLRRTLARLEPADRVVGVMYFFCVNDALENYMRYDYYEGTPILKAGRDGTFTLARASGPAQPRESPWLRLKRNSSIYKFLKVIFRDNFRAGASWLDEHFGYYRDFLAKKHYREGMRYVFSGLAGESCRRGARLFVASCIYPAWEDAESGAEVVRLTGQPPRDLLWQRGVYDRACTVVEHLTREAGGTYIDLRGTLAGMSYHDYAAAPSDWHYSEAANERIGRALGQRIVQELTGRASDPRARSQAGPVPAPEAPAG
jgi:hypothetical protein